MPACLWQGRSGHSGAAEHGAARPLRTPTASYAIMQQPAVPVACWAGGRAVDSRAACTARPQWGLVWEGYPTSRLFGPRLHVGWVTVVATLLRKMAEYAHRDPQAVTDGEERRERHARKTNSNAAAASACKRDGRRRGGHAQSHTSARSGAYEVFPAVMLGKLLELEKQVVVANCACEQSRAERSRVAELRSHTRCGAGGRRYRKSCRRGR